MNIGLIGCRFDYLGKTWTVTKMSAVTLFFTDGQINSSMDLSMFPKVAENIRARANGKCG